MAQGKSAGTPDNRIAYLDYLRVIAILGVVILHVSTQSWSRTDVNSGTWMILNLWDSAVRWSVPVFVMISGALFLNPKRKVTVYDLWSRKIPRILAAFLFWSLVYGLYNYAIHPQWTFHTFLMNFLTGYYHMWFLFLIIGLYLVVPLLRKITEDRRTLHYFLVLALFFGFLIPTIRNQIVPFYRALAESDTVAALFHDYDSMRLYLPLGYTGYFVLGYYLHKRNLTPAERGVIYGLGILGFALTAGMTGLLSRNLGKANSSYYEFISCNVLFESMAVFVLVRYSSNRWNGKVRQFLSGTAGQTFGIYLIHLLFIDAMADLIGLDAATFTPILSVPLLAAVTFTISMFAVRGIRKLGRFSNYIS